MGRAAYKALIRSIGDPVSVEDVEFAYIGDEQIDGVDYPAYRVDNAAWRIMSKASGITLYDSAGPTPVEPLKVDWLRGVVIIPAAVGGDLFGDFDYFPTAEIVGAKTYTLSIEGDILDDTNFKDARSNGGIRTKVYGLHDVSFSIERNSDYGQQFLEHKQARSRVLIDVTPGGEDCGPFGGTYRGWFMVETDSFSGDIGDLESESISFNLDGREDDNFVFIPWEA
jgi:hypothetical protein